MENILRIFSNYVLLGLFVLVFLFVWGMTLAAIHSSARRHDLPRMDRLFWLAVGVVLPLVGYGIYLAAGLASRVIAGEPQPEFATVPDSAEIMRSSADLKPVDAPPAAPVFDTLPPPILQPAAASFRLNVIAGPTAGVQYVLENLPLHIGRGETAHIRITGDMHISRQHAEIYQQGAELHIRDLNSTHGTSVNQVSISDAVIHAGDRIMIGESVLILEQV